MSKKLPEGWKCVKLGSLFEIKKGKKVVQIDEKTENSVRCIQIEDLRNNLNIKYCEYNEKYLMAKYDDILIAWDGANAGTVGYGIEGAVGSTLAILRCNEVVCTKYIAKYLQSKFDYLRSTCTGATIPHINRQVLESLNIPLPPLEEQEKIVSIVEKAENAIEKRDESIKLLDELVKSKFIEMFGDPITNPKGWNIKKLENISSVGSSKRVFVDELVEEGIPFYRGTEIGALSNGSNIKPTLFITEEHYNILKESAGVPVIGDLLMPSICPDGRIWRVDTEKPFYFKDGRVLWVHLEESNVDSIYLKYMLREKMIRDYNSIASGTTFAELKIFALKGLDIMLPPLKLQREFTSFIEKVDKLKYEMENSLKELENNFNSLMQKAFNGEL